MNHLGARSSMLSGSIVGSVSDNSSIYYNPGGMAFIKKSSITVTGDLGYADLQSYKNAAGDGIDLSTTKLEFVPSVVSGVIKDKKRPWLTINYALMNYSLSSTTLDAKNSGTRDVLSTSPNNEHFSGTYQFSNETREKWLAGGRAYRINENLGIGFSVFAAFRSETKLERIDVNIYDDDNSAGILAYNSNYYSLRYNNVALFTKIGWAYRINNLKMGGNITTPRVALDIFSSTYFDISSHILIPDRENYKFSYTQLKVNNRYKSPWIIDYGLSFPIADKSTAYTTIAYFGKIDTYNLIKDPVPLTEEEENSIPENEDLSRVNVANKAVLNIALGYEYHFSDKLTMLYGFRTDFNNNGLDELKVGSSSTFSRFDIYHFSGGVDYDTDKYNLNLGLSTSFGVNNNSRQFVDLTSPDEDNLLYGDISNTVDARFIRIGLIFGFTYKFQNNKTSN